MDRSLANVFLYFVFIFYFILFYFFLLRFLPFWCCQMLNIEWFTKKREKTKKANEIAIESFTTHSKTNTRRKFSNGAPAMRTQNTMALLDIHLKRLQPDKMHMEHTLGCYKRHTHKTQLYCVERIFRIWIILCWVYLSCWMVLFLEFIFIRIHAVTHCLR